MTLHDSGTAISDNYLKIVLAAKAEANRLVSVNVLKITDDFLYGLVL